MRLLTAGDRISYLLKDRVVEVAAFIEQIRKIVQGGWVVDPAITAGLLAARRRHDRLSALSDREREVLTQMALGRSNLGISRRLWITVATVEKHVASIFDRLQVPDTDEDHRRVLAVVAFLGSPGAHAIAI